MMLKYSGFAKNVRIAFFLSLGLMVLLVGGAVTYATEPYVAEDTNLLPGNMVVLDEVSSQELVYTSPDQSTLLFRNLTPQLEGLVVGDVLWLGAAVNENYGSLRQIERISREESGEQGLIIQTISWVANHHPLISGLIARPSTLEIGEQSDLTCFAADEDGDELYYSWMSDGGSLTGNGAYMTWSPPDRPGYYTIQCEVSDSRGGKDSRTTQIRVGEEPLDLTNEERNLIRKYGWGNHDRVIRWPDGYVDVYDATNYDRMQEVLDQWNRIIGGEVIFRLSNRPQSPVKVTYNPELGGQGFCSHLDTHWRDYGLYAAEVKINPDASFCGHPGNSYALYLHAFSGVAGFDVWKGETVDQKDWQNFKFIPEIMQTMVKALYRVPLGYVLNKDL